MTRQEAIEKIEKYQCKRVGTVSESELEEALNMAIEALENRQNCVKCVHYYETEDERGVHSHCEQEPIIRCIDRINQSIDFEEKWLFDVLSEHKRVGTEDIRIAFSGIRKVIQDIQGGDEE